MAGNNGKLIWTPSGGVSVGAMELKRPPISHVCPRCRRSQTLILPQWPCKVVWKCSCGWEGRVEVGSAVESPIEQRFALKLRKKPVLNTCDDCGATDWIVLPDDGGDLRWECGCGAVWVMRWTKEGGMRGRVRPGAPQEKVNPCCGCGLEDCPICNPK